MADLSIASGAKWLCKRSLLRRGAVTHGLGRRRCTRAFRCG